MSYNLKWQTHMANGQGNHAELSSFICRLVCVWGLWVECFGQWYEEKCRRQWLGEIHFSVVSSSPERHGKCLLVSTSEGPCPPPTSSARISWQDRVKDATTDTHLFLFHFSRARKSTALHLSGVVPHVGCHLEHLTVAYFIPEGFNVPHNLQMNPCHQLL